MLAAKFITANPLLWLGRAHFLTYGFDPLIDFATNTGADSTKVRAEKRSFQKGDSFTAEFITLLSVLEGDLSLVQFTEQETRRMSEQASAEISASAVADIRNTMLLPYNSKVEFLGNVTVRILRPVVPSNPRQATIKDVAKLTGFSLKTVSRVINEETGVAEETRAKTLQAILDLGYRRNTPAHNLRSGTSFKTIALITADLSNTFYANIAETVAGACAKHGYRMITASNEEDPLLEREIIEDFVRRGVSGIIFTPAGTDYEYLEKHMKRGVAFGAIDRPAGTLAIDTVLADNRSGTEDAIIWLINQGHTRIGALLDSDEIYTIQERRAGIFAAFEKAGLNHPTELLITGVHSPEDAESVTGQLMNLATPPTALYAGNNRALIGALRHLNRVGKELPIVSFEPFEFADLLPQKISIVDYSVDELAIQAAENLFKRITSPELPTKKVIVPTTLLPA